MAKAKTIFFCNECGGESVRWVGKCPYCGAWNTMVEQKIDAAPKSSIKVSVEQSPPQLISKIEADQHQRFMLGIEELDTVLGGGLMPGSSVLLGGEPGIGKSTLLLQVAGKMAVKGKVLYVSGEEAAEQIKLRHERLHGPDQDRAIDENLFLLSQTDIDVALEEAAQMRPALVILDSVQALYSSQLDSVAGSVSQVRAVAAAAISFAHQYQAAVMLIGHVTKEGMLAGPRVLEHMVDTVLYFEGERYNALRLLRAVKNRFGSTNEIGVFEMREEGLLPLAASAYFIDQRHASVPGAAVSCVMQGSRPLLIEVQALVVPSVFGNPRRLASGYDYNRLLLIIAVLERKLKIRLADKDIYLNIAGGMRLDDQAADLAAAAAIVSSATERPIEKEIILLGEVGLLGELRGVVQESRRLKEALAFGFKSAVCPKGKQKDEQKIRRFAAASLTEALTILGLTEKE